MLVSGGSYRLKPEGISQPFGFPLTYAWWSSPHGVIASKLTELRIPFFNGQNGNTKQHAWRSGCNRIHYGQFRPITGLPTIRETPCVGPLLYLLQDWETKTQRHVLLSYFQNCWDLRKLSSSIRFSFCDSLSLRVFGRWSLINEIEFLL